MGDFLMRSWTWSVVSGVKLDREDSAGVSGKGSAADIGGAERDERMVFTLSVKKLEKS